MNNNIFRIGLPAAVACLGLVNTGSVATRCYDGYPAQPHQGKPIPSPSCTVPS